MANPKINPANPSIYALEETILFLRPATEDAILGVHATDNDYCRFEVPPPEEQTDPLVDEPLCEDLTETTSKVAPKSQTPVKAPHPFVLRIGFDTIEDPSPNGFTVGNLGCDINIPTLRAECHFVIHYAMQSGALMISARDPLSIGNTDLSFMQSLLLMHRSKIRCGGVELVVEFPDISDCAQSHKAHYQRYFERLGYKKARYLPTSLADSFSVGSIKIVGPLGHGGFGIVYKVVHIHTGTLLAMKLLNGKPSNYKEVNILKKLRHVSQNSTIRCIY